MLVIGVIYNKYDGGLRKELILTGIKYELEK